MAPPTKPLVLPAAQPKFSDHFDAWNSSATGHQRAENRMDGSPGWRQSRTMKLSHQFKSGNTGGKRISDEVGAGSADWDEERKTLVRKDVRARAQWGVGDMLSKGMRRTEDGSSGPASASESGVKEVKRKWDGSIDEPDDVVNPTKKGIFDHLTIYINGSTHPIISDHKLKHLLAENGARLSIHLGRRSVTHVILGKPCGASSVSSNGAGGGLAGTKIQKEIKRVGGCGVKYVGVEWVLECIRMGRRVPEAPFVELKIAPKGQKSVYGMFKKSESA